MNLSQANLANVASISSAKIESGDGIRYALLVREPAMPYILTGPTCTSSTFGHLCACSSPKPLNPTSPPAPLPCFLLKAPWDTFCLQINIVRIWGSTLPPAPWDITQPGDRLGMAASPAVAHALGAEGTADDFSSR